MLNSKANHHNGMHLLKKGLAFLFLCLVCACSLENPVESTGSYTEYEYAYWILEKQYYFDNLPAKEDYSTPAELFAAVPDKYTRYVPPVKADEDEQQMMTSINNGTLGFELVAYIDKEFPLVAERIYPGSPAERAGLPRHATLLAINDESLKGDLSGSIFYTARAKRDTATLTYAFENDTATLLIPRENVYVPTVFLDTLVTGNPIIKITKFAGSTYNREMGTFGELDSIVSRLQGVTQTVVIDLRNNPGGQIDQCTAAADLFLGEGPMYKTHFSSISRNNEGHKVWNTYKSSNGDLGENWNIMLWANKYSASCAEIFITALKRDSSRVRFAGTTTYGKGIGQSHWKTQTGALIYVTSMMIYDNNKVSYHDIGIEPDIFCADLDYSCLYNALAAKSNKFSAAKKSGAFYDKVKVIADPSDNFMGGALIQSEELR